MADTGSPDWQQQAWDAIVVGSGPNGLAAAVVLAQEGLSVVVLEQAADIGGGTRTRELTLPGFRHDVCSAIHPMSVASPLFRKLPLEQYGLRWIQPPAALAHPLDDGSAAVLRQSFDETATTLGADGDAWRQLFEPFVVQFDALLPDLLAPLGIPSHPGLMMKFGRKGFKSACRLANQSFREPAARALFGGLAAHSFLSLDRVPSAAVGLVLGIAAHAVGWPIAAGGSQQVALALAAHFKALGGRIVTGYCVESLDKLPGARAILLDVTPRQVLLIAGERLSPRYRRRLGHYRYGPAAFKVDYALNGPIPWKSAVCLQAGTVHLGGTLEEIAGAENLASHGLVPERPYVLVAQQSLFDASRAPAGQQTAWAYCHVPHGCRVDVTARIERQLERFAPGFRDRVLARHILAPADLEKYNPNYVGGDINGGVQDLWQLFARPVLSRVPYATSDPALFICSSSTPPGGGVHGMCGYHAARAALRRRFGRK